MPPSLITTARNELFKYVEETTKAIICRDFKCDFYTGYGRSLFYRRLCPHVFMTILKKDNPGCTINNAYTWNLLIKSIPTELSGLCTKRCYQIIVEYAAESFLNVKELFCYVDLLYVDDLREAIAYFYEPFQDRSCEWIKASLLLDVRLFQSMVYRIVSNKVSHRTTSVFKRALVYVHLICHAKERIFLCNEKGVSSDVLITVRRAYEHILFGRFRLEDFTSSNTLFHALLHPTKGYKNSFIKHLHHEKITSKKHLLIKGERNAHDLVLASPSAKPFSFSHYRGALELMSSSGKNLDTVYLDSRLFHHLLPSGNDIVFDAPIFLPMSDTPRLRSLRLTERLLKRLSDFEVVCLKDSTKKHKHRVYLPCEKTLLLTPTNDSQYERDKISAILHVKDYLLWTIGTNKLSL